MYKRLAAIGLLAVSAVVFAVDTDSPTLRLSADYLFEAIEGPDEPPVKAILENACPFEGCSFGVWPATMKISLHEGPHHATDVIADIPRGTCLHTITGELHTIERGKFRFGKGKEGYCAADIEGAEFFVYGYLGESIYRAWHDGLWHDLAIGLGQTDGNGMFHPMCGNFDPEPTTEWWVKVRLLDGTTGWTDQGLNFIGSYLDPSDPIYSDDCTKNLRPGSNGRFPEYSGQITIPEY